MQVIGSIFFFMAVVPFGFFATFGLGARTPQHICADFLVFTCYFCHLSCVTVCAVPVKSEQALFQLISSACSTCQASRSA
jgi:hypothetical protein